MLKYRLPDNRQDGISPKGEGFVRAGFYVLIPHPVERGGRVNTSPRSYPKYSITDNPPL